MLRDHAGGWHDDAPVSYTHLDVYKRQGVEIGTLGAAYREKLGYLPQEFGFYPEFTVQDYLEYMAALKGCLLYTSRCV